MRLLPFISKLSASPCRMNQSQCYFFFYMKLEIKEKLFRIFEKEVIRRAGDCSGIPKLFRFQFNEHLNITWLSAKQLRISIFLPSCEPEHTFIVGNMAWQRTLADKFSLQQEKAFLLFMLVYYITRQLSWR